MAEVQSNQQDRGRHRKVRAKKLSTYLDMTPMVDLAFLLLTFFMLTTTFSKSKTMEINMPADGPPSPINNAVTFLLGDKDRIFWYYGEFKPETQLKETDFSAKGIRKVLVDNNTYVNIKLGDLKKKLLKGEITDSTFKKQRIEIEGEKKSLFVLIKADNKARYKNVIDVIDECNITNVGKYSLTDMMVAESELLKAKYIQ